MSNEKPLTPQCILMEIEDIQVGVIPEGWIQNKTLFSKKYDDHLFIYDLLNNILSVVPVEQFNNITIKEGDSINEL